MPSGASPLVLLFAPDKPEAGANAATQPWAGLPGQRQASPGLPAHALEDLGRLCLWARRIHC